MSIMRVQKRSACYLSTPEHLRSFFGRFIYIYTDKGELTLTDTALQFVGKQNWPLDIPLDQIERIRVGHYSRWAKPIRLDYIAIEYRVGETRTTIMLTPTRSWATPVWDTNKIVTEWISLIEDARSRRADPIPDPFL